MGKRKRTPLERAQLDLKIQKERVEDGRDIYGDFAIRLRDEAKHLVAVPNEQRATVVAMLSVADAIERLRMQLAGLHFGKRAEEKIRRLKRREP